MRQSGGMSRRQTHLTIFIVGCRGCVYLYTAAVPAVSSDYYARGSTRIVLRSDAAGRDGLSCTSEEGGSCATTDSALVASTYWSCSCFCWRSGC